MELMYEIYSEITLFSLKRKARCMLINTNMKFYLLTVFSLSKIEWIISYEERYIYSFFHIAERTASTE